jgi:Uma2 family endonuclease
LLREVGDSAIRLTYDRGLLEIAVPSRRHEQIKRFLGEIAESSLKKLAIAYEPAGNATWRRQDKLRGLEADECYHIQHVAKVRGKQELDLDTDPPPDLAIEVDLTSDSMDKAEIYAALGIPELWRTGSDGQCQMFELGQDGSYRAIERSVCIPRLTPAILTQYLQLREQVGHSEAIRRLEAEVLSQWTA